MCDQSGLVVTGLDIQLAAVPFFDIWVVSLQMVESIRPMLIVSTTESGASQILPLGVLKTEFITTESGASQILPLGVLKTNFITNKAVKINVFI